MAISTARWQRVADSYENCLDAHDDRSGCSSVSRAACNRRTGGNLESSEVLRQPTGTRSPSRNLNPLLGGFELQSPSASHHCLYRQIPIGACSVPLRPDHTIKHCMLQRLQCSHLQLAKSINAGKTRLQTSHLIDPDNGSSICPANLASWLGMLQSLSVGKAEVESDTIHQPAHMHFAWYLTWYLSMLSSTRSRCDEMNCSGAVQRVHNTVMQGVERRATCSQLASVECAAGGSLTVN